MLPEWGDRMNAGEGIRVMLADDHAVVRQGLRYIIDAQPDMEVVGEATDGATAVTVATGCAPDVVLMDIQMPNGTGLEATRAISASASGARVLLLTTFDVEGYVFDGIRSGATGYLLKDAGTHELLEAIRCVHRGQAIYRTATASKAIAELAGRGRAGPAGSARLAESLTERETEVLQQMADGRRNEEIGKRLFVSEGTVKTHVHRILQKLGAEDRTQAVAFAIREGIVR